MVQDERIVELEALEARQQLQNEQLLAVTAELRAGVQELEARLAKDSHNSSKPPSSDGLRRQTKSLRRRSGKTTGGQLGHRGETLHLVATPDAVVEHRPAVCAQCQTPLEGEPVVLRERRQVLELPALRLRVREHQAVQVRCPQCQHVSLGTFPAEAPSRAQYGPRLRAFSVYLIEQQFVPYGRVRALLGDLLGAQLSEGTLVAWVQQGATTLAPVEAALKAALRRGAGRHNAGTGGRRGGGAPRAPRGQADPRTPTPLSTQT